MPLLSSPCGFMGLPRDHLIEEERPRAWFIDGWLKPKIHSHCGTTPPGVNSAEGKPPEGRTYGRKSGHSFRVGREVVQGKYKHRLVGIGTWLSR